MKKSSKPRCSSFVRMGFAFEGAVEFGIEAEAGEEEILDCESYVFRGNFC